MTSLVALIAGGLFGYVCGWLRGNTVAWQEVLKHREELDAIRNRVR
jgi:hypothetical protein